MRTRSLTIHCLSTAASPITHMSGTSGNEALVAREPIATERGVRHVPVLSGNALRHRTLREPGARWLVDQYGLAGHLTRTQLDFLFHGGNRTEKNVMEDTRLIADMKRTWPLLRLLGGSLPQQILPGSVDVRRGVLVCEENRPYLESQLGRLPPGRLLAAERFVGQYQYTRGQSKDDAQGDGAADGQLMIFSGQCVVRGSLWHHAYVLQHATELDVGCLLWSLRLWQEAGGTIGGQAARGHGVLETAVLDCGIDQDDCCRQYVDYVDSVRDDALEWLERAFAKPSKQNGKPRPKKQEAAT